MGAAKDKEGKEEGEAPKPDEAKLKAEAAEAAARAAKREEDRLLVDVGAQVALIERSALTKDPKAQNRVLRHSSAIQRKLSAKAVSDAIGAFIPDAHPLKPLLAAAAAKVPEKAQPAPPAAGAPAADGGADAMEVEPALPAEPRGSVCMEVEAYLCVLLATLLLDAGLHEDAVAVSSAAFARVQATNQRTLDAIGAKVTFYYARAHELAGRLADVRSPLLRAHRSAALHHNGLGQVVCLNLLLRNYLAHNLYEQVRRARRARARRARRQIRPPGPL